MRTLLALLAFCLLSFSARADFFTTLPPTGYNLYTNDAQDNDTGDVIGAPYMTVSQSIISTQPGSLNWPFPGARFPYVTFSHTNLSCDSTTSGTVTFESGMMQWCNGTAYKQIMDSDAVATALAPYVTNATYTAGIGGLSTQITTVSNSLANYAPLSSFNTQVTSLTTAVNGNVATSTYNTQVASLTTAINGKLTTPTGSASQCVLGNGTVGSCPVNAPSFTAPTRTINTAFQTSATTVTDATYSIDVTVASALLGAAQGTVSLQYADNSGMSTNLVTVAQGTNATSGLLNLTNVGTVTLHAQIPSGKWIRLTSGGTGSPTFSAVRSQEVLY